MTKKFNFILVCCLVVLLTSCAILKTADVTNDYKLIQKVISQPIDHADSTGTKFDQQIFILIPEKASITSPVFFILGPQFDLSRKIMAGIYKTYGSPRDVIFIGAEHRGYGQSVTFDEDQTVPSYVRIDQALTDFHQVVETLKKEYRGPWMIAGCSYSGGLAINYAFKYPENANVILSSSGAVDFPFITDSWDRYLRSYYGERFYNRLANHVNYFKPKKSFDENWLNREFLSGLFAGIPQHNSSHRYKILLRLMSYLPTQAFLKVTIWIVDKLSHGEGSQFFQLIAKKTLTREEAITGKFSMRVWRYQQCTETGLFWVSEKPNGVFPPRTYQDICKECEVLFSKKPTSASEQRWSPRAMLNKLIVPIIYVGGGKDPSGGMLEPDYEIKNGKYLYIPNGRHCPDRHDRKVGKKVLAEMLKFVSHE